MSLARNSSYETALRICEHPDFFRFGELLEVEVDEVRDLDHFLMLDGSIIVAQGWTQPDGVIIGEAVYSPDPNGNKTLFGQGFRKSYQDSKGNELPYTQRPRFRVPMGPGLDAAHCFKHRSIFARADAIARFDVMRPADSVLEGFDGRAAGAERDLAEFRQLFGPLLEGVNVGMTGSMRLGSNAPGFHDLDLVMTAPAALNQRLVGAMAQLATDQPARRVQEFGKGWRIRLLTQDGLLCSFFGYEDPAEAPLASLRAMPKVSGTIELEAVVTQDVHNSYMPTVVCVSPTTGDRRLPAEVTGNLPVIITHLGARGDFHVGDRLRVKGNLVEVHTKSDSFHALSIVERDGTELLSPPWPGYYTSLGIGPSGVVRPVPPIEVPDAVIPFQRPTPLLGLEFGR